MVKVKVKEGYRNMGMGGTAIFCLDGKPTLEASTPTGEFLLNIMEYLIKHKGFERGSRELQDAAQHELHRSEAMFGGEEG
ncbi:MAG: hypothetical protein HY459_01025 [Parcubacteria group bacterium]|nr:hypothetical protein [Parcubacteria group bacterium]